MKKKKSWFYKNGYAPYIELLLEGRRSLDEVRRDINYYLDSINFEPSTNAVVMYFKDKFMDHAKKLKNVAEMQIKVIDDILNKLEGK